MTNYRKLAFCVLILFNLSLLGCGGGGEPHAGSLPLTTSQPTANTNSTTSAGNDSSSDASGGSSVNGDNENSGGDSATDGDVTDNDNSGTTGSDSTQNSEDAGSDNSSADSTESGNDSTPSSSSERAQAGESLYNAQCTSCHGPYGEGSIGSPIVPADWTLSTLATRIAQTMPANNVSGCIAECAENVAHYILADFLRVPEEEASPPPETEPPEPSTNPPTNEEPETDPDTPANPDSEPVSQLCSTDLAFFEREIWNPILTDCITCHSITGPANTTLLVYAPEFEEGYLETNFETLLTYSQIDTPARNGSELLLSKPRGVAHEGGQRLSMTTISEDYANLEELLNRFENPTCDGTEGDLSELDLSSFTTGISNLPRVSILTKAAQLFASRPPTTNEIQSVENGDLDTLKLTIRRMMTGTAFEQFLMEGANDQLLTNKYLNNSTPAIELLDESGYPAAFQRIETIYQNSYNSLLLTNGGDVEDAETRAGALRDDAWMRTSRALALQPLRTIVHFVNREEPYTSVLTTDKIIVNHWSNNAFSSNAIFFSLNNDDDWRSGDNLGYRIQPYPTAGLLTTPTFLARYPSTATNRNRARARWAYQFFLGVDIEQLAQRPIDAAALADTDNPTMNNASCAVCHQIMDPVAGAFQNFGDNGFYLEFNTDSLPETYKQSDLYQEGDRWYSDMRTPGFDGREVPDDQTDSSLQWLAQQITTDERFASGTVKFWWPAVFGETVAERPLDTQADDYDRRLLMYRAQNVEVERLAEMFRSGTAGTEQFGSYNLKDLLLEMVLSSWFIANEIESLDEERTALLAKFGRTRLITPEQLNRKMINYTGFSWSPAWDEDHHYLAEDYRTFYGGIDSDGIDERNPDINAMMNKVVDRMTAEMSCEIVSKEFQQPAEQRLLFPHTEIFHLPVAGEGESNILTNIQYLHTHLLGESLSLTNDEIATTYALFNEIRDLRITQNRSTALANANEHCNLDWEDEERIEVDPNHTLRAWMAVLNYLISDARFLYQ